MKKYEHLIGVATAKSSSEQRIAISTIIGTAIKFYDYSTYATIAEIAFNIVFFTPTGSSFVAILVLVQRISVFYLSHHTGSQIFTSCPATYHIGIWHTLR